MRMPREIFACGLWVAALSLMAFGSLDSSREGHNSPFLAWGVFTAVVACVPSGWCIIRKECERRQQADDVTIKQIVEVVDALHEGRKDVARLR